MSAGVSDQRMKGQGNQVINSTSKNVETDERFIPWSQQVDDAPYEPLPSPTEGSHSGCYESSSGGGTQFQYPPFKVKEGAAWSAEAGISNKSSRRLSSSNDNYDNDGYGQSFGQQSSYNYFPKNGDYNNSWSSQQPPQQQQQMNNVPQQQSRKSNNYDEYYRSDRGSYQNDNVKSVQRGMQNMGIDGGNDNRSSNSANTSAARTKSTGQTSAAPKQMTWASIASQPAKQPLRVSRFTSSTSSTLKKKGPGMPPPPMVPGKHNMDIGTWDSPKNAPVLVPPPPPPVIPVPIMEPTPTNQNKNNPGLSNNGPQTSQASGGTSSNNTQQNKQQGSNNQPHRNYNQSVSSGSSNSNNINMRPSWADQRDPPHIVKSLQASQYQRPSMNEERNNSSMRQSSRDDYHGRQAVQQQQEHQQPQPTSPLPPAQISHPPPAPSPTLSNSSSNYPVLDELRDRNTYNPAEIDLENATNARFFVIKSYSEDDIHRSIKYAIWCSTEHGNKRLDQAYRERESENGIVYLFFSVNGSGHFCGMAQMMSAVDYNSVSSVWSQAKWKGTFKVKWIYVKDVPNGQFRHIRLENNENKSVTNSRDTQEVPNAKGVQVLKVLHVYKNITSIFDDFFHYEKRQEEEDSKKYEPPALQSPNHFEGPPNMSPPSKSHRGGSGDYERGYDKGYHSSGGGSGGGGGGTGGGGGYREKNYSRGGYHNYENRRQHDDHRGGAGGGSGYDRERFQRDGGRDNDGGSGSSHYNNIRENSGGDYHNNRGFHRNEFRRDDRGNSGFNNRDRERDRGRDNYDGGFMSRGDNGGRGGGGGGFRGGDHYNRDRGDQNSRGRGRGVGHRN